MWANRKFSNLLTKLVALNSIVILLVILLAGLSVKDYACYLVNSEKIVGQDLLHILNGFLWKVGIIAFIVAGLFHYISVKRIVEPLKHLSSAAKEIKEGKTPSRVTPSSSGELKELIENFNAMSETIYTVQEQREEMLRDIAHELRTPLTNINGYLEALQNRVIDGNPELFGSLLEESRRITRIVELITELNSWNKGNYFLEKQFSLIAINKVLTETLTSFHLKLHDRFKAINIHIEPEKIMGNQDGLIQVFTNVLQNILDYNTGSILTINAIKKYKHYIITFTHTGQFIHPDKKERIFERFYRFEESRSTKSEGAGLGLTISKSIIDAHGGKIGINTDGLHHIFWIKLPIMENETIG
ncbi:cell wall metabolism sensor histidine kinase WalK [Neobacillus mesonae]|uniref:sensor histidine kinase n=1 Tax=Neobacillus mesonae TaxID=1193713 RepID=UPI00203BB484|nr:ATP-binding protein [Neobacillus mesonae]MCM3571251.1 ATP-binding protein [Neobacillus mesonae]